MFTLNAAIDTKQTIKFKPSRFRQFKLQVPFLGDFWKIEPTLSVNNKICASFGETHLTSKC
jgi:hypothetical protein